MKKKVRYFRSSKQHTAELLEVFWDSYFAGRYEGVDAVLYCGVIHVCNTANMNLPTLDACLTSYAELGRLCGMDWRCVKSGLLTLANHSLIRYQRNGRKVLVGLMPLGKEEKKQKKTFSPEPPLFIKKKEKKEKSEREERENASAENSSFFEEGFSERKRKFVETVEPYVTKYGARVCEEFIEHWTEPTPDGEQMRFELEKTWSVAVRLSKWRRYELKAALPKVEERKAAVSTAALERVNEREVNEKRRDWERLCACPPWAVKLSQSRGLSSAADTEAICQLLQKLQIAGQLTAEQLALWEPWHERREREKQMYLKKYGKLAP